MKRYVKFYAEPAQAHGELIANEVYRELGLPAPNAVAFTDAAGRTAYASELVEGKTLQAAGLDAARAKKVLDGFAGDVLVANWDVVGLNHDNILVGKRGKLFRIDNGGALLMRAKAGRKPSQLLGDIPEWAGFFDLYKNPAYAKVGQYAGIARAEDIPGIAAQLRKVVSTRKRLGGWGALVTKVAPDLNDADRSAIVDMLEKRTDLLAEKLRQIEAAARRAKKLASGAPDRVKELLGRNYRSFDHGAAVQHGRDLEAARAKLTSQERSHVYDYTSSGFAHTNEELRAGRTLPEVPILDSGIRKGRLVEDVVVHRGVRAHDFLRGLESGQAGPGYIFQEKAYTSTSLNKEKAFDGIYRLRIKAPAGSEALWVGDFSAHKSELEVLLPRNSQFYIVAATKDGHGKWTVECLLLPQK